MIELRTLKNRSKLRRLTDLAPIKRNTTRWTSTFDIERFIKLRQFIEDIPEIEEYMLTVREIKQLDTLMKDLNVLSSITLFTIK